MGANCLKQDQNFNQSRISQSLKAKPKTNNYSNILTEELDEVAQEQKNLNDRDILRIKLGQQSQSTQVNTNSKWKVNDFKLLKDFIQLGYWQRIIWQGYVGAAQTQQFNNNNNKIDAIFAMKILNKNTIGNDRQIKHIKRERTILEAVKHEFLVNLQYAFQSPSKLYLVAIKTKIIKVMDFVRGGELFYHLRKNQRFPERLAKFYASEILLAVEDLKPENILIDEFGHIKLTDFGLSKMCVPNEQLAHSLCGTPEYMAPEVVVQEEGYDKQCDWWSFGAILYEMLVGQPPFYSAIKKDILRTKFNQPLIIPTFLSDEAIDILVKLLEFDPKKRIGNKNDAQEIMGEKFFSDVNFDDMLQKKNPPPYVFRTDDFFYFDPKLLKQEAMDTPIRLNSDKNLIQIQQDFSNFTYQKMELVSSPETEVINHDIDEIKEFTLNNVQETASDVSGFNVLKE